MRNKKKRDKSRRWNIYFKVKQNRTYVSYVGYWLIHTWCAPASLRAMCLSAVHSMYHYILFYDVRSVHTSCMEDSILKSIAQRFLFQDARYAIQSVILLRVDFCLYFHLILNIDPSISSQHPVQSHHVSGLNTAKKLMRRCTKKNRWKWRQGNEMKPFRSNTTLCILNAEASVINRVHEEEQNHQFIMNASILLQRLNNTLETCYS